MDTALQRLAQVQDLGVAGQDLSKHDENIPDVGVISRLQAVNWSLDVAETEDMSIDKNIPSTELRLPLPRQNFQEQQW